MDLILQIWGGSSYLLNKILFAVSEGKRHEAKRILKLFGWAIYIIGVPAWVIILISKNNWIAASIEAGGLPSMVLGIYSVYCNSKVPNVTLDRFAKYITYAAVSTGVLYSFWDYGGITSISQLLEIGVMVGFLFGSYLLAKNINSGWIFFMLMNGSMSCLMHLQNKPLLMIQQLVSLGFVVYGYTVSRSIRNDKKYANQTADNTP